jgi:hypothetical protein
LIKIVKITKLKMRKNSVKFSQELFDEICEKIANGESLRKICKDDKMPNLTSVWKWLNNNEELSKQYARAREEQAETFVDEILDIADYKKDDTYLDEDGKEIINQEVIARSRLRVDARKWIASKLKPKKFGDYTKIQAEVKDTSSTSSWLGEVLSEIDNNK